MSKKRFASVWDAVEDTPEKAENMKLRSSLMIALKEHMAGSGLSQAQVAKLFGVTQPRVSDLMRGKIDVFGLDALVNMAAAAGLRGAPAGALARCQDRPRGVAPATARSSPGLLSKSIDILIVSPPRLRRCALPA